MGLRVLKVCRAFSILACTSLHVAPVINTTKIGERVDLSLVAAVQGDWGLCES